MRGGGGRWDDPWRFRSGGIYQDWQSARVKRGGQKMGVFSRSQRSMGERRLWAQFDALQMGMDWDEEDIRKPQILIDDVFGESHPGSSHLVGLTHQASIGVYERGGRPGQFHVTDICDGCAQGHDGMNYVLASREVIADMVEIHGYFFHGMD